MNEDRPDLSNRERLRKEVEELSDEQVAEVLEYLSIMKTMREQEEDPVRFKDEIMMLLNEQPQENMPAGPQRQPGNTPHQPSPKKPS